MPRAAKSVDLRANLAELRSRVNSSSVARQFGFELAEAEHGRVVMKMRVAARHRQVHGVVHGGVMAALVDTAGGLATYMALPPGARAATIELKINYLEGVERGMVFADARVVRIGRHIAVVDCDARDEHGRLVAKALMTFFVGPFGKNGKIGKAAGKIRRG
ncbi:MAG: PaaI family thioesterase [Candidatus Acidiferrales bacterium]